MKNIIPSIAIITMLASCSNNKPDEVAGLKKTTLQNLNWLCATWQNTSEDGVFTESWKKINDSLFYGEGRMVLANGDTVFSEELEIAVKDSGIFYIPEITDQNDGKPVFFKLVSEKNNEFIFENKLHDFPQRIIYKHSNDSLLARVEGLDNGAPRAELFNMKKTK